MNLTEQLSFASSELNDVNRLINNVLRSRNATEDELYSILSVVRTVINDAENIVDDYIVLKKESAKVWFMLMPVYLLINR